MTPLDRSLLLQIKARGLLEGTVMLPIPDSAVKEASLARSVLHECLWRFRDATQEQQIRNIWFSGAVHVLLVARQLVGTEIVVEVL